MVGVAPPTSSLFFFNDTKLRKKIIMENKTAKIKKIRQSRLNKFGFKNGIKIHIELQWWAILLIVVLILTYKYFFNG